MAGVRNPRPVITPNGRGFFLSALRGELQRELMRGYARKGRRVCRGIPPLLENIMAKGQAKKSREARKPKKEKVKTNASNPSVKPGSIKGLENMKNS